MSINVPPRGLAGSLQTRQARPMNGLEVSKAIQTHLMTLTDRMLSEAGLLSDQVIDLTEQLKLLIEEELSKQSRLQKVNVTYPKVGWSIKTRLEELEDGTHRVNAEVELDLERNLRLNIRFGQSGFGNVVRTLEEEKIPNSTPDNDRKKFGLPVEAEFLRPDGTVGKVDLSDLKPQERRAARTVDVGRARVTDVVQGEEVKLPSELPEVTFQESDLIAEPPPGPKEPSSTPLPPKGSMAQQTRPNVKFKK